eukprot:3671812-Rhodomonas_salina.3
MSGTDPAYGAAIGVCESCVPGTFAVQNNPGPTRLRVCYTMPCTDLSYGAIAACARATRYAVLT